MRLLKSVQNKKFCLQLSGTADIYDVFGRFVNVIQKLSVLPHERYDNALKVLDHMVVMKNQIDHEACVQTKPKPHCVWPRYHEDRKTILESETYQGVSVTAQRSSTMYQTRLSTSSKDVEIQSNSVEQVQDDVTILVT